MDGSAKHHSGKSALRAIGRKAATLSFPKKIRFAGRLIAKAFGSKRPLYLGGFYDEDEPDPLKEERRRRLHEENAVKRAAKSAGRDSGPSENLTHVRTAKSAERTLSGDSKGGYLAVAVDTLDRGGLEQVIYLLCKEWKKTGKEVRVFCTVSGGEIADKLRKEQGTEVLEFASDTEKLREYLIKNPPDAVNTHFLHVGIEVFYELGIPIAEVIHNMYVFLDYGLWRTEDRKSGYVDRYIAVSQCAKDVFLKKFPAVSADRITVIGNTFDVNVPAGKAGSGSESGARSRIRAEFGIPDEAFVFTAVGSIDPRKNNLGMVKAFSLLKKQTQREIRLLLTGAPTDMLYEKKVKKLVLKEHLQDVVIFAGQRSDVGDILTASDAMLMISYYEGWSVAATEAVGAGLPVIHSDCGSGKELVSDGQNGILTGNPAGDIAAYSFEDLADAMNAGRNVNTEEIVEAMHSLLQNEKEWKSRRNGIAQYAAEHFHSAEVAEKYLEIIKRISIGTE